MKKQKWKKKRPCTSIPCLSFSEIDLGHPQPIAWEGLDIVKMMPHDDWNNHTPFGKAEILWEELVAQADGMRIANDYDEDTAITVRLPNDPAFAEVFEAIKARAIHGSPIIIRLASEEINE